MAENVLTSPLIDMAGLLPEVSGVAAKAMARQLDASGSVHQQHFDNSAAAASPVSHDHNLQHQPALPQQRQPALSAQQNLQSLSGIGGLQRLPSSSLQQDAVSQDEQAATDCTVTPGYETAQASCASSVNGNATEMAASGAASCYEYAFSSLTAVARATTRAG